MTPSQKTVSIVAIVDADGVVSPGGLREWKGLKGTPDFFALAFNRADTIIVDPSCKEGLVDHVITPDIISTCEIDNIDWDGLEGNLVVVGSADLLRRALPFADKLYLVVLRSTLVPESKNDVVSELSWGRIIYEQDWDILEEADEYAMKGSKTHTYVSLCRVKA